LQKSLHYYSRGEEELVPFPLPAGTINAHIRHGDKESEMRLVPSDRYFEAAKKLMYQQPFSFGNRTFFVSSDDVTAIHTNRHMAEAAKWGFVYSKIERMAGGFNSEQWVNIASDTRLSIIYTQLLQLLMSLESDAWIGTRASNGNRLIDELRCIWVDKCQNVYVDVGYLQDGDYAW
jgi:hypothetical protein